MTAEAYGLAAAALLLAVGFGYGWGRRHGVRQGFGAGVGYAPLALRQASWEAGSCVLCGAGPEGGPAPELSDGPMADVSVDSEPAAGAAGPVFRAECRPGRQDQP